MIAMIKLKSKIDELLKSTCWSNALYLGERSYKTINNKNLPQSKSILNEWLKSYERKETILTTRLKEENLTFEEFTYIINDSSENNFHREMQWFIHLKETFKLNQDICVKKEQKILEDSDAPFVEFIIPFLKHAKSIVQKSNIISGLSRNEQQVIFQSISQILYQNIIRFSLKTLIFEINKSRLNNELVGENPEARYDYFVTLKFGTPYKTLLFLSEYPVLARLISEFTNNITVNLVQSIERFFQDKKDIEYIFRCELDKIKGLDTMGDPHRGGKCVVKFYFNNGESLIYKPRNLSIDMNFQNLLEWLNRKGIGKKMKVMKVINKGDYGWQEFINYVECKNKQEIKDFYIRQGQFLAILYMLNATDCHYENVIANGSQPILVDLESIFHTFVNTPKEYRTSAYNNAINIIGDSVIRTSLLPVVADEFIYDFDVSGLGGGISEKVERYKVINSKTDRMKMVKCEVSIPEGMNLPKLNGKVYNPEYYIDNIKKGFKDTYKLILNVREKLKEKNGPLSHFKKDHVRVILRNTGVYSLLQEASEHPKYLKSGLDRSRLFEILWRLVEVLPERSKSIQSEIKEMLAGDIPYFSCPINSSTIFGHNNIKIDGVCQKTSYLYVMDKLNKMGEDDLKRQLLFIDNSLKTKYALGIFDSKRKTISEQENNHLKKLDKNIFLNEAIRIGHMINKDSIKGVKDDSITWIGFGMNHDEKLQYTVMDMGIYNGLLGMVLFYAYLAEESKEKKFKEIAELCLQTVLKEESFSEAETISAYSGYGSLVYTLQIISRIWRDESLLNLASTYFDRIDKAISFDKNFDFLNGSAGMIMVALNFYKETGHSKALDIARKCGEHLINNAVKLEKGYGWTPYKRKQGPFLSGLSHGNSGVALALMYLSNVTGQNKYNKIGLKAIAYENSLYDNDENNWLDLRTHVGDDSIKSVTHWCNGAPGIGLSRLKMLQFFQLDTLRKDLELAINKTLSDGVTGLNYSLCHGDLGNIELLLLASTTTKDKDLYNKTLNYAFNIISSVKRDGGNWKCGIPGGQKTPNFMVGLAGIGYQLLRLYNNDLPSVLILDDR